MADAAGPIAMDAAGLQALIDGAVLAAVQVATQAAAQAAAGQQANQAPPAFSLNPAGTGNEPWNFQSSTGMKLYIAASAPLATTYDGVEEGLTAFLRELATRAKSFGLDIALRIPDNDGILRDLTREHGCLTLANVQAAAQVYLPLENRAHQASSVLSTLIMASITAPLAARLAHSSPKYTLVAAAAVGIVPQVMEVAGACMLYELIGLVTCETRATVSTIMDQLSDLRPLMQEVKSDIPEFNTRVNALTDALNSRNAAVPQLLNVIF